MKRLLFIALVVVSCIEQDIVQPFTSGQVVHMLTGGTSKTWIRSTWKENGQLLTNFDGCEDTLIWELKVSRDTVVGYQYTFDPICILYDTVYLGKMVWGADSLNFIKKGVTYYKKPILIRPGTFTVSFEESGVLNEYSFVPVEFGTLSKQVDYLLTDGNTAGDSRIWVLTSRTENNIRQPMETCADTIRWVFRRDGFSAISLAQLTPGEGCNTYSEQDLGSIRVSPANGLFRNVFYVDNGVADSIVISSFTPSSFTASYSITIGEETTTYKATCVAK